MTKWFPPIEDYFLAHSCPRCGAQPWTPCDVRTGRSRWHAPRMDRGINHKNRDIGKAPWVEDREPGRQYHSFSYPASDVDTGSAAKSCEMPVIRTPFAQLRAVSFDG